jgi:hypothetical protein
VPAPVYFYSHSQASIRVLGTNWTTFENLCLLQYVYSDIQEEEEEEEEGEEEEEET